jgi:hypothetical protein
MNINVIALTFQTSWLGHDLIIVVIYDICFFIGLYYLDMNLMHLKHIQNMYKLNAKILLIFTMVFFFHHTYICV